MMRLLSVSCVMICLCMVVVDNAVNMANRTSVNHRTGIADGAMHQQRATAAPPTSSVRADVAFKRLPFYDILAEIMKPSSLGLPYALL